MEAAGLAIGVAGLAGLFSACLDAIEKAQSYRGASRDSDRLDVQFQADVLRFKKWGQEVGIRDGILIDPHHIALDDEATKASINQVLAIILDLHKTGEQGMPRRRTGLEESDKAHRHDVATSKRKKVSWALWGKEKREKDVELYATLVQKLYDLIPPGVSERKPEEVFEIMEELFQEFKTYMLKSEQRLAEEEKERKVRLWRDLDAWVIGSDRSSDILHEATKNRLDQTCEWIFERSEFQDWLSEDASGSTSNLLWINGPAGFGKTMLFSRIIEYLDSSRTVPIVYFVFSSNYESHRDPFTAVRSWLSQLMKTSEKVFDLVYEAWATPGQKEASQITIERLFVQAIQLTPGCILAIDGLDECKSAAEPYMKVTANIKEALKSPMARALVVSRGESNIRLALGQDFLECRITVDDVRYDTAMVSEHIVLKNLPNKSKSDRAELSKAMTNRCDGQFLWLKLQSKKLKSWKNKKQLERSINESPIELSELYERDWQIIQEFEQSDRERAVSLLRWAAFALRPLTVGEITEAVIIEDGCKDFPLDELPDIINEEYVEDSISRLCGSLVEIRENTGDVTDWNDTKSDSDHTDSDWGNTDSDSENTDSDDTALNETPSNNDGMLSKNNDEGDCNSFSSMILCIAHFSVRQFLLFKLAKPGANIAANTNLTVSHEQAQHAWLARSCIQYISFLPFRDVPASPEETERKIGTQLQDYAARNWHRHVNLAEVGSSGLETAVSDFFVRPTEALSWWVKWHEDHKEPKEYEHEGDTLPKSPVALATELGLIAVVKKLLERPDCDVNQRDTIGRTALFVSCENGQDEITKLLIDAGADPMLRVCPFIDDCIEIHAGPISEIVGHGNVEMLQYLVRHGVDVNQSETLVRRVQPDDNQLRQIVPMAPLALACMFGHLNVVRFLLENGADVHESSLGYPLTFAADIGHVDIVDLLIKNGARVDVLSRYVLHEPRHRKWYTGLADQPEAFVTPLYHSVEGNHLHTSRKLIENGADPHRTFFQEGLNLLHVATDAGAVDVLELLLEAGIDPNKPDKTKNRLAPLHLARSSGVAKILLQHGANIEQLALNGNTPLHVVANRGLSKTAALFLAKGASIDTPNKSGWTPLYPAILNGRVKVVKLLLNSGAEVNRADHDGNSPLTFAVETGHLKIVRLLLQHQADIEHVGSKGRTALFKASQNGNVELVQLLLKHNAHPNTRGEDGSSPLHWTPPNGYLGVTEALIRAGADIEAMNSGGKTPLFCAAKFGYVDLAKLLLDNGAEPNRRDKQALLPLHFASYAGHDQIVELFLGIEKLDIDTKGGPFHQTPLNAASINGNDLVVQLLLSVDQVDVNSKDINMKTPISNAAERGYSNIVSLLLETGQCDIHQVSKSGFTPLELASFYDHEDVVNLLIDHGAPVSGLTDVYGLARLFSSDE
ncbi:unnamed protein product [Clonostachys rosea]|uniref:NACHT domain-containing protein n=1 Tax=Bionectria ochroleuca TaxID=29856 RepID=A0ABY6U5G9_BIOOC|nr:unnamed protein product [Clonostachys rosea]